MRDRHNWFTEFGDLLVDDAPSWHPRLNKEALEASQQFYRLAYNREDRDCAVRALAVACAAPYEKAHEALRRCGRADGGPATLEMLIHAAPLVGYRLEHVRSGELMMRSIVTCYRNTVGGYVFVTADHAAGMFDGELIDFSRDCDWPVLFVFRAIKIDGAKKEIHNVMSRQAHTTVETRYNGSSQSEDCERSLNKGS